MENERNIMELRDITVEFPLKRGLLTAVNHVDFNVIRSKLTALVGESGSGKSTLASTILNLVSSPGIIKTGKVMYQDRNILEYDSKTLNAYRWKDVSMVFQSAQNTLNPVMTIQQHYAETYKAHKDVIDDGEMKRKFHALLEDVRLEPERVLSSYPHELSGGMRQRVMIAFSLLLDPDMIILDEPTTALDVITQDYIFNILDDIHRKKDISMLLMTHDIAVVAKIADYIGVMYAGNLVEYGDVYSIFGKSLHPYTYNLIQSAPSLLDDGEEKVPLKGNVPDLFHLPKGCSFCSRCPYADGQCENEIPAIRDMGGGHLVACHHPMHAQGGEAAK